MDAFRAAAATVTEAPLPQVGVLGIDETRRGRTRWEQDPGTGGADAGSPTYRVRRRARHRGPARPGRGPQRRRCPGLAVRHPLAWRKNIRYVAIDMSPTSRAAIHWT